MTKGRKTVMHYVDWLWFGGSLAYIVWFIIP